MPRRICGVGCSNGHRAFLDAALLCPCGCRIATLAPGLAAERPPSKKLSQGAIWLLYMISLYTIQLPSL